MQMHVYIYIVCDACKRIIVSSQTARELLHIYIYMYIYIQYIYIQYIKNAVQGARLNPWRYVGPLVPDSSSFS